MKPNFAKKLCFYVWKTNIGVQKMNDSRLKIFGKVIDFFLVDNIDGKSRFFEKTFLLVDISINITFEMSFLILNNVKINFIDQKL